MNKLILGFDHWMDEYKPWITPEGNFIDADPRAWEVSREDYEQAVAENRVWSQLDPQDDAVPSEGAEIFAISGIHFVNVTRLLITEVPIPKVFEMIEVVW